MKEKEIRHYHNRRIGHRKETAVLVPGTLNLAPTADQLPHTFHENGRSAQFGREYVLLVESTEAIPFSTQVRHTIFIFEIAVKIQEQ